MLGRKTTDEKALRMALAVCLDERQRLLNMAYLLYRAVHSRNEEMMMAACEEYESVIGGV